jgi:chemotaxis protein histidine kinase CheA
MTFDMTQFHPVFFEETAEHLATMEALLLYLDPRDPDPEQLDDLGRAAHSIKGSGSTFAFRDLANLAEAVEWLVTGARKSNRPLSEELIAALREACGVLKALLAGYRGEGLVEADAATRAIARLRRLSKAGADTRQPPRPQPAPVVSASAPREKVSLPDTAPDLGAVAAGLRALSRRTAQANNEVMDLIGAAGIGGLHDATGAVRALGEAIERNAALVEQAADNTEALREAFRALVQAIALQSLSPAAPPARPRPLPKVRRVPATADNDKERPEF